ncbi:hypothetical protein CURTO8I2_150157 [Curtobacterium sp. 8I-2]|nr:hypothetical protein CURTO8I2_150157 [Curtobacterium sp. 8I-2]
MGGLRLGGGDRRHRAARPVHRQPLGAGDPAPLTRGRGLCGRPPGGPVPVHETGTGPPVRCGLNGRAQRRPPSGHDSPLTSAGWSRPRNAASTRPTAHHRAVTTPRSRPPRSHEPSPAGPPADTS